jgi:hypothetical protein
MLLHLARFRLKAETKPINMLGKLDIDSKLGSHFDFVMKRPWLDLGEKLPGFRLEDWYSILRPCPASPQSCDHLL